MLVVVVVVVFVEGIIPVFCEELFSGIEGRRKEGSETEYQVG